MFLERIDGFSLRGLLSRKTIDCVCALSRGNMCERFAQGFDLEVAKSVGSMSDRVLSFTMEVTGDKCQRPLQGVSNQCSEVVKTMRELGFTTEDSCGSLTGAVVGDPKGPCQANMVFNAISAPQ